MREVIRRGSGESIDLKTYEADMRHLIDTYIEADAPRKISTFDNMPLLEIIVQSGLGAAVNSLPEGIRSNETAVAETIINNVRKRIIKEHLNDPAYYDRMSVLLEGIIADLKAKRLDYQEYLHKIAELAKQVQQGKADTDPLRNQSAGVRAIFNNLRAPEDGTSKVAEEPPAYPAGIQDRVSLALAIDHAVKQTRPDGWRENVVKERVVKNAIKKVLNDATEAERIFQIIKQQREY
jgi:type I restriction enzyme R subunit